ncbi:hypothetical protein GGX14DRAFT_397693 [Mycena pura]|uniref:Uncharacterized protein n=1 Tax=Mycena pura TaxID=153505 RepID=A0AAD6YAG5_9AGAR|nr:hypothetical protein GGX14DRAFT_397693 [Mycena pura]
MSDFRMAFVITSSLLVLLLTNIHKIYRALNWIHKVLFPPPAPHLVPLYNSHGQAIGLVLLDENENDSEEPNIVEDITIYKPSGASSESTPQTITLAVWDAMLVGSRVAPHPRRGIKRRKPAESAWEQLSASRDTARLPSGQIPDHPSCTPNSNGVVFAGQDSFIVNVPSIYMSGFTSMALIFSTPTTVRRTAAQSDRYISVPPLNTVADATSDTKSANEKRTHLTLEELDEVELDPDADKDEEEDAGGEI